MTLNQFTAKIMRTQSPAERYPIGSAWEYTTEHSQTVAYEILGFIPYGEIMTVAVEYQRWDKVWGWVGNGHYERLELTFYRGEYKLISYTNWTGIEVRELN